MSTLFDLIACYLQRFVTWLLTGIIDAFNAVIRALAIFADGVLGLLPGMPDWPTGGNWAWLNWAFPVSSAVGILTSIATLMLVFYAIKVALNWAKAL